MLITIINVVYVLLAIAMVALILMQRGTGAAAGAGFGGGASSTVFGSRGASSFLSKSTKWLAIVFFGISMGMAWYATHRSEQPAAAQQDLGVMGQVPVAPQTAPPAGDSTVPVAPASQPSAPDSTVPSLPAAPSQAAPTEPAPQQPASDGGGNG